MAQIRVTVPEDVGDWAVQRVQAGEYNSLSDYVRALIRQDQAALADPLNVEGIRLSIEKSRTHRRTSPAEDVFARLEENIRSRTD